MPSTSGSDNPMVQHAGHRNFEKLLRCGVRLFEYPHTLLHQKVMTVDGAWSAIGSSNFDDRSFETNDEIMLSIRDEALARRLDAIFEKYVARAREIQLERWAKRPLSHRAHGPLLLHAERAALTDRICSARKIELAKLSSTGSKPSMEGPYGGGTRSSPSDLATTGRRHQVAMSRRKQALSPLLIILSHRLLGIAYGPLHVAVA